MLRLVAFFQRRFGWVLAIGLILTVVGGFFTALLYQNLRTDLEELLPRTSRGVIDLDTVARRLVSIENLAVLVFSDNTEASKRFVTDLATKIEELPGEQVANVSYRLDRELDFFAKRQALYLRLDDVQTIRKYIEDKIDYERSLYNPLNIFSGKELTEPILDFSELQQKYAGMLGGYDRFPDGFFATPDEKKRVVLIDVPGKALGIDGIRAVQKSVQAIVEELNPASYSVDLKVNYSGSVQEMLEEQEALVEDLAISTVIVCVLVSLVMLLYFRYVRGTIALLASLLAGTFWTFGISYFAVGYLNANSAFLGSIVIGNGINFGIILLARYLEERRKGRLALRASMIAVLTTYKATLTAALAAGLSYGSLAVTSFRGFKQFGVIGLFGMLLCWIAAYTLLPAMLVWLDRVGKARKSFPKRKAVVAGWMAKLITNQPFLISVVSTVLTVISIFLLVSINPGDLLETNFANLRSKKSETQGAAYYSQYLDEIFQRFLTPVVVLPSSRENAGRVAARLKELKEEQGESSAIVSVQTIDDFLPKNQKEKIKELKRIASSLTPRILRELSDDEKTKVKNFLSKEAFVEIDAYDLPALVRLKFSEKDGTLGKMVLVEPPLDQGLWKGDRLLRFVDDIRKTGDSVEEGAPVAGSMVVSADLISSISKDGPRATLLSILAVVVLAVLLFREPKMFSLALLALFVGASWFFGLVVLLNDQGFRINFMNFVALPITFGIGIDYGVNVFQRYRTERKGGIIRVIRETGGAVGLCSLTTMIGYSSLLIASNQGFVSFGLLSVLGEITCGVAALISLPAILLVLPKSREIELAASKQEN